MAAIDNQDEARTVHDSQIYTALGAFLLFFSFVVLISIFFTDTMIGRATNLCAGSVIGAIGGAMFYKGIKLRSDRSRSEHS
ncbi:MAG TPA: hypothetical protein PKH24_13740 [Sedimentisphaerales bacterium]|jgi:hypothetical protein|nr:hypothetical protein [Sedimentisphaerales bacterium]HNU28906.1 hypothetical protein [Sedimentisphaerales bacterium]